MINELIEQIGGRERLEFIAEDCEEARFSEIEAMASALLAVLDAKPVGTVSIVPDLYSIPRRNIATVNMRHDLVLSEMRDGDNVYTTPPADSVPDALREAVNAIYFTDSSDYFSALWSIVRFLSPETADLLAKDERAAFERVNANLQYAAVPAPGDEK